MELSDLQSDELLSFCGDFDSDDDIDAIFLKSVDPLDEASNLFGNDVDLSVTCCPFCCQPYSSAVDL